MWRARVCKVEFQVAKNFLSSKHSFMPQDENWTAILRPIAMNVGVRITAARWNPLTVIHSDGPCAHDFCFMMAYTTHGSIRSKFEQIRWASEYYFMCETTVNPVTSHFPTGKLLVRTLRYSSLKISSRKLPISDYLGPGANYNLNIWFSFD